NIGAVLTRQGKYEEALSFLRAALEGSTKKLGDDHVSTISASIALAGTYGLLQKNELAMQLYEPAVSRLEKALGGDHFKTLAATGDMASCLSEMGQHEAALELLQKVHLLQQKRLGEHHPLTLNTLHQIGETHRHQGQYDLALENYARVLAGRETTAGNGRLPLEYYCTVESMADAYKAQGVYSQSVDYYERAWRGIRDIFSDTHPMCLNILDSKADALISERRFEQAITCLSELFRGRIECFGREHELTHET
ncbi:TPR-like protein, partial [Aspergillus ellipticus CBS 707.79]